ncbi:site-2 protease family protein [Candidatus Saccharibacteria bacterium]|nr:site-2 protease family protein [Candidatus Saccharibacteria bacterium]
MILTIVLVLLVFSVLVIAHEWGHYKAARRNGVKVDEFGVGFPPRLWGRKSNGTLFSINTFPIGGFVRLKGEDGEAKGADSFASKSAWVKTKIVMAGVTMNLLIAYLLITFLLIVGMPPLLPSGLPSFGPIQPAPIGEAKLTVLAVTPNSAAARSGLKTADQLVSVNGQMLSSNQQLQDFTKSHGGQQITLVYKNSQGEHTATATLGTDPNKGNLGVASDSLQLMRYSWWQAPVAAVVVVWQLVEATIGAFAGLIVGLFTQAKVSEQVAGPIGIVSIFSQIIQFGWRYILVFVASISLSLAVINALPLPALDGGRELLIILRRVGVKITPARENLVHVLGFAALIILLIVVSISDINRLR